MKDKKKVKGRWLKGEKGKRRTPETAKMTIKRTPVGVPCL